MLITNTATVRNFEIISDKFNVPQSESVLVEIKLCNY